MFPPGRPYLRAEAMFLSVFRSSVRSFVHLFDRYQTRELDSLKTNEPILMTTGTSGPRNA